MEKLKKYFGGIEMTWARVLIFAVATAVLTAGLNVIPALNDTSFQDIAVNFDCWFLFALFVIVNCKTWKEAALKCFVFFLVSQPLIYLLEVPFTGWGVFDYYGYWFKLTLATLPGGAIAFLVKKKNWLSVAVLSVATCFLAGMAAYNLFNSHHYLSAIFCVALDLFFVFVLLDDKKHRIVALILVALALAGSVGFYAVRNSSGHSVYLTLDEGEWTCTVEDKAIADVEIVNGNEATITSKKNGYTILTFKSIDADEVVIAEYSFLADGKNVRLEPIN